MCSEFPAASLSNQPVEPAPPPQTSAGRLGQQIADQPTMLYFTTITFKGAGLETLSAALSSVGEVAVMVLGSIFVEFV